MVALSPVQEGILYHSMNEKNSMTYFEQICISLMGTVNIDLFKQAWHKVIEANEALRSLFRWSGLRKPVQIILKENPLELHINLLESENQLRTEELLEGIRSADRQKGFHLQEKVPFRVYLTQVSQNHFEMMISNHHILLDGWSTGIILKEFTEIYERLKSDEPAVIHKKTRMIDYIKYVHNLNLDQERRYWLSKLNNLEHAQIKSFIATGTLNTVDAKQHIHELSSLQTETLRNAAKKYEMTIAGLIYAAWSTVLHIYSCRRDILFGTTFSGRNVPIEGITEMVGLFIRTLPFRVQLDESKSVQHLLQQVQQSLLECENHSFYPLGQIMQDIGENNPDHGLDTLLVVQNYPLIQMDGQEKSSSDFTIDSHTVHEHAHYPISVGVQTFENIKITISYRTSDYNEDFITGLLQDFVFFLNHMGDKQKRTVNELLNLHQNELKQRESLTMSLQCQEKFFVENDTGQELTYAQWFEEQVRKNPDQLAVVFREEEWTYKDINHRANRLSQLLIENKAGPEVPIGVFLYRSVDLIITVLAILKSGAAFVPMDPDLPLTRINDIWEDTRSPLVIVDHHTQAMLNEQEWECKFIHLSELDQVQRECEDVNIRQIGHSLAYILYTSGTSGKPKGVMIENRNLVHFIRSFDRKLGWTRDKIMLSLSTFSFDIFIVETLLPLVIGMKVVMADALQQKDPILLSKLIERHEISIIQMTPTRLKTLLSSPANTKRLQSVTDVLVGGEALPEQLALLVKNSLGAEMYNLYGPTETTVWSTVYRYNETTGVSIGKEINNVKIQIMDDTGRLKPRGVPGELWISGDGVGRGYWNSSHLTADRFVSDPDGTGKTMYRTGDLGRWDAHGHLEFLGRMDRQVKIRGYRIELAEVESHLLLAPDVAAAAVIVRQEEEKIPYLCAYLVGEVTLSPQRIKAFLLSRLPDYMVPSFFIQVEQLPQNHNGKLDIKSLPIPAWNDELNKISDDVFVPQSELEHVLMHVWNDTFSLQGTPHSNVHFIDLGGHSLQAMYLVIGIQKELGISATVQDVFRYPTLGQLAAFLTGGQGKETLPSLMPAPQSKDYPLSSAQLGIYLSSKWEENNTAYNLPFEIRIKGNTCVQKIESALRQLIQKHEALRTSIRVEGTEIRQIVHEEVSFRLEFNCINITELNQYKNEFIRPFDLSQAPLFRARLLGLDENNYVLLGDLHHCIADHFSMQLLMSDFNKLYQQIDVPKFTLQYKDYAVWEKEFEKTEAYAQAEKHWMTVINEAPIPRALPSDGKRSSNEFSVSRLECSFSTKLAQGVITLADKHKTSTFSVLLAAHFIMMIKYTGQEDITVGVPLSGRWHPDLEKISGMFVNTMPIRHTLTSNASFSNLVGEVKKSILLALQNQYFPLSRLVQNIRNIGGKSSELFQTVFTFLPMDKTWELPEMSMSLNPLHHTQSKFDLTVTILEEDRMPVQIKIDYAHSLFESESAKKWVERYMHVLDQVTSQPDRMIQDIHIIETYAAKFEPKEETDFQF
ncbi:amino acid adenylation domain-containing protein [Paenibacillus sp. FSL R7-0652]|uniref:amino acid adenylation domain-containing protein n=1 Tax=Paenibacillus sp. FSL R7-0652 TaxID=2921687 RepID=UPI00315B0F7B